MLQRGAGLKFNVAGVLISAVMLVVMTVTGARASDRTMLWQSRDQFVALEGQGSEAGQKAKPNSHPVSFPQDRLKAMLASLEVRPSATDPAASLFTVESIDILAPHLQAALKQAGPGEDVTFAIIGLYHSFIGIAKSPKVTTGRLFVRDGRVNLIFGLVQKDFNDREDRRLDPLTPGARAAALPGEWRLIPRAGEQVEMLRRDWVAFGPGWQAPVVASPAAAPPAAAAAPGAPQTVARPADDRRSPVDRLIILNELKSKGLISDEEYNAKRSSILNEL